MTFLLFPILHDLAEFLGFGRIYFICPMVLASAMQTEFFFLALLKATRMLMKGLFRSRCSRWDYSLICIPLGDRSSMMKSFAFHIRSFHSSILLGVTPPMRNALHSSLVCAEPKKQHDQVVGHWDLLVRWAESGGWCYERLFKSDLPLDVWASKSPSMSTCWCTHANSLLFFRIDVKGMNELHIYGVWHYVDIHGHRTLKAPHPVWSAQLTRVPPS